MVANSCANWEYTLRAASASFNRSLARWKVSRLGVGALTFCFTRSLVAGLSAGLDADALEAEAELSGISDFFRQVSPFLGMAFDSIGRTGFAIWEEDSLPENEISILLLPVASLFLFSFLVSVRTSFLMPSLNRAEIVCRISATRSSSRVFGGPLDRSFGVGPCRVGLAGAARVDLKLAMKLPMMVSSESLEVTW
jgi:hypothetical protein